MKLLDPSNFMSTVAGAYDKLEEIARLIDKYCECGQGKVFLTACNELDYETVNSLIDRTILNMVGNKADSVSTALTIYVEKFPRLEIESELLSALLESEKVKVIGRYSRQIRSIIREGR